MIERWKEGNMVRCSLLAAILLCQSAPAQIGSGISPVYELPFGSTGNTVEIAVINRSTLPSGRITVTAPTSPSWLTFGNVIASIPELEPGEESAVTFTFAVARTAPVGRPIPLIFTVATKASERRSTTFRVSVSGPLTSELHRNFPNPFNPSTSISYLLDDPAQVSLKVYDLLGREVALVDKGHRSAGFHQVQFNGSGLASGCYIYRLAIEKDSERPQFLHRVMILTK